MSSPDPSGLTRPRLTALVGEAARVVVVTAPPGAGKTTMLAAFAAAQPPGTVAWCRLDTEDTASAALLCSLAAALGAPPTQDPSADEVLTRWERPGAPHTLVLDDVHLLADSPAEAVLARIVALLPAGARVVLAARAEPAFVSCGPRLAGAVTTVTADDLRFRSWEVEELFRDCYRAPLAPEDAAALTRHTEGWAAGLQLFHLGTQAKPAAERHHVVASMWGMSYLLRRYLTGTVLGTLPADVADFLVRTSALGTLEGSLCDRLLGRTGSDAVLRGLADAHLFTVRCDDDGVYYRYHAVLRGQLECMLAERLGAADTRAWYRRAGALLDEAGLWPAAYRAYARAEDWGAGAQVLQRYGVHGAVTDAAAASVVPGLLDDDPWLTLAEARRLRAMGRLTEAVATFDRAERRFDDPRMRQRCRAERRATAAWVGDGAGMAPAEASCWERLRVALRGEPGLLVRLAAGRDGPHWRLAGAVALALDLRPAEAIAALRQVDGVDSGDGGDGAEDRDRFVVLAARLVETSLATVLGRDPEHTVGELVLDAELAGYGWLARMGRAVAATGDAATLVALRDECDRDADPWGALLVAMMLGVTRLRAGADAGAELADQAARAHALDAPLVESFARTLLAEPGLVGAAEVPSAVPVTVRCFGQFTVRVGGQEVAWRALRPRAQALLRLLCLHAGTPVHEETLLAALWPTRSAAAGRRTLQVAVSAVRGVLEPGRTRGAPTLLQRRGDTYVLELPPGSDSDVQTFTAALHRWRAGGRDAVGALRAALAAYRGELLPDDGPAEWVVAERERLRGAAADAGAALAEHALAGTDTATAVQAAQAALRADPFHDTGWRLLIRACERAGDGAAAARARQGYAAALAELGVPC